MENGAADGHVDCAIDVHAHCLPSSLVEWSQRSNRLGITSEATPSGTVMVMPDGRRSLPVTDDTIDLGSRIEAMKRTSVDMQVLSPLMDVVGYSLDSKAAIAWAQIQNDALASEAAREPDRLRALATVPLQDGRAAAAELERAIDELGMVGVEVGSRIVERQLDDRDLDPFWEVAAARRCVVLLHPVNPEFGRDLEPYGLRHLVGRPAETTFAAARLILSGVIDRHAGLRVVVVHGGGFLPYQIGRISKFDLLRSTGKDIKLSMTPKEAIQTMYFDTVLSDNEALNALIGMVGRERVVLGSDYPFGIGDLDPVASLSFLAEDTAALIRGANAARLLDGVVRGGVAES